MTTIDRSSPVAPPSPLERAVRWWRAFWFRPESTATLGLVRIAFGVLMIGWTISLLPDLNRLFGEGSVLPTPPSSGYEWSLFELDGSSGARIACWAVLLAASVALTAGWHSRLAALAVFVGIMTFERGNPYVFNSGDALLRLEAFYLLLAPTGAAFSLDRRRTAGSFWSAQTRAPWALRLLQVQLSVVYLFSVLNKLGGATWREGTAVSYALRMTDIGTVALPPSVTTSAVLMNVVTWTVLALELGIGVLVWRPRARPWVLGAGVVLHLGLTLLFGIAFFSFAMFVLYLSFIPPERARRAAGALRARVGGPATGLAEPVAPTTDSRSPNAATVEAPAEGAGGAAADGVPAHLDPEGQPAAPPTGAVDGPSCSPSVGSTA